MASSLLSSSMAYVAPVIPIAVSIIQNVFVDIQATNRAVISNGTITPNELNEVCVEIIKNKKKDTNTSGNVNPTP
ncbi:MAG: hypothetical protein E6K98_04605 [Thaumarchaeota archaeon]|nr:MAG: hypothetical protein E6K98_04605 [Nitrososphaerota archaeon]TLX95793.1 MAG: hypothetical protein E6K91_01845 [Nitrososphaerota archaeon]